MTLPPWREEPIGKRYDREAFDCGEPVSPDVKESTRMRRQGQGVQAVRWSRIRNPACSK